jgi:hypothetical protein
VQNNPDHKIGFDRLLLIFEDAKNEAPKGVGLKRNRKTVVLQFVLNGEQVQKGCNCSFTLDGISDALKKARKVAEKLKTVNSISGFDEWYEEAILEKNRIEDDTLTFKEAIALVENEFWNGFRRSKKEREKRDRNNPSDIASWNRTYGDYYKHLPQDKQVTLEPFKEVLKRWEQGTSLYIGCIGALKKLARLARKKKTLEYLDELSMVQTVFRKKQEFHLNEFLEWHDKASGSTASLHGNVSLEARKRWLWAFSVQLVYGLRISEVFAIQNLDEPYTTEDKHVIPALNDETNLDNVIVIGKFTQLGTTTKTGYRLAIPFIPPSHPDLIERLNVKRGKFPVNKPRKSSKVGSIRTFYAKTARENLVKWNAPFTQTHAERGLANILGMQAGISQEIRTQSLGHDKNSNDRNYKKRQTTQTTLDLLLRSNKQAIDFVSALNAAKRILDKCPESKDAIAELLSIIYQKDVSEIMNLL